MLPVILQNLSAVPVPAPDPGKKAPRPFIQPTGNLDIALGNRNEITGRFNFVTGEDGDVSFDDTAAHAVMTSALEDKASYWADENHGSDLFTLQSLTARTPSQAEAMTRDSLVSLEGDGSIVTPTATAKPSRLRSTGGGTLEIRLRWTTPGGAEQSERVTI